MNSLQKAIRRTPGAGGEHSIRNLTRTAVLIALCLLAYTAVLTWHSWEEEKAELAGHLTNIVELEAKAIDGYFRSLESDLKGLAGDLTRTGNMAALDEAHLLVKRFHERRPELFNVTLFQADGEVLLSARYPLNVHRPTLAGDASYTKFMADVAQGNLFGIGQPLVSVTSKVVIVPVRLAIRDPQGDVGHVISANLPQEHLRSFWMEAPITTKAAIGLIRDDGFLLSRYPVPANVTVEEIYGQPRTGALINFLRQNGYPESGLIQGPSSLDGPDFLTAFRRMPGFPVTLFIALPASELRAAWLRRTVASYAALLLLFAAGYSAYRGAVRRQRTGNIAQLKIEEAMRESEAGFRAIMEASPVPIAVNDSQHNIAYVNAPFTATFGYESNDIRTLAAWWSKAYPDPEYRLWVETAWRTRLEASRQDRRPFEPLEVRVTTKSGEVRTVLATSSALGQSLEHLSLVTLYDITERKQAEIILRESEQRWKFAIEGAGHGLWDWNVAQGTVFFSQRWKEMLGYAEEEIGSGLEEWSGRIHPDDLAPAMADVQSHLDGQTRQYSNEHRLRCKDGSWKWILDRGLVVERDAAGKPLRMIGTHADMSGRRQAEALRASLESQLRESQKMESLGTLAGGIAHDFNNILAIIAGNVELARQDTGPGHAAFASLEEIGKASRRAADLVRQILAFSRRQKLERKATSLSLVVLESARLIRASLPALVSLEVDCGADTPSVLADATQVKQVVLNLCSNAARAVDGLPRRGVIEIRLHAHVQHEARGELRPGRYACLTVRDNGAGMDAATRERIFEPFFTTKPAGSGLGLSVVHGIAHAHEACCEVESTPGAGSTFRLYFPALEADAPADEAPEAPHPVRGQGQNILLIDDEEGLLLLMKRLLERRGYRVSGYTDPREALAAVRVDPAQFDLVVTDYNMPHLSGLEVGQALKEIRADLPVVLASGYITEELRQKAPAAGICELIGKPDTANDLCEAVARFANARKDNCKPSPSR